MSLDFELPRDSKFLLISAFLASYNSPKYDKRLFSLENTNKTNAVATKVKDKYPGPKVFTIDRLLAIYQSITDTKWNYNAELYSQISTLVGLKLLSQVSPPGTLDNIRLKCTVSNVFIKAVAGSISFDLSRYLISED